MQPIDLHTTLLWLLIIGVVCLTSLAGATVNRLLTRRVGIKATDSRTNTSITYTASDCDR